MPKGLSLFSYLLAVLCVNWLAALPARALADWPSPLAFDDTALAIIVNKTNPVENLSSNDLRSLLLSEQKSWPHGRRVTIVMREPGQPERVTLLKTVCRMTDSDYNKYFMQAQFIGDLQTTPKVLATAAGMRKFVFNVPGAIGYVRASEVDASVKIVRVDGRLPGEPGYRLRLALLGIKG
jgi:ABC-type phosphate transport system substrate-binding protein